MTEASGFEMTGGWQDELPIIYSDPYEDAEPYGLDDPDWDELEDEEEVLEDCP